jgi:hypothetical protein
MPGGKNQVDMGDDLQADLVIKITRLSPGNLEPNRRPAGRALPKTRNLLLAHLLRAK